MNTSCSELNKQKPVLLEKLSRSHETLHKFGADVDIDPARGHCRTRVPLDASDLSNLGFGEKPVQTSKATCPRSGKLP